MSKVYVGSGISQTRELCKFYKKELNRLSCIAEKLSGSAMICLLWFNKPNKCVNHLHLKMRISMSSITYNRLRSLSLTNTTVRRCTNLFETGEYVLRSLWKRQATYCMHTWIGLVLLSHSVYSYVQLHARNVLCAKVNHTTLSADRRQPYTDYAYRAGRLLYSSFIYSLVTACTHKYT